MFRPGRSAEAKDRPDRSGPDLSPPVLLMVQTSRNSQVES